MAINDLSISVEVLVILDELGHLEHSCKMRKLTSNITDFFTFVIFGRERESVNLVDLFNFAEECERNKFNYKLGDFTKIDFLGEEGRRC